METPQYRRACLTECKKRSKIDIRKDRDVAQFGRAHGSGP